MIIKFKDREIIKIVFFSSQLGLCHHLYQTRASPPPDTRDYLRPFHFVANLNKFSQEQFDYRDVYGIRLKAFPLTNGRGAGWRRPSRMETKSEQQDNGPKVSGPRTNTFHAICTPCWPQFGGYERRMGVEGRAGHVFRRPEFSS